MRRLLACAIVLTATVSAGSAVPAQADSGWTVVANPATAEGDLLISVSATSASDAWAVGSDGDGNALVEHWNGHAWKLVTPPSLLYPTAIAAASSTDVWVTNGTAGRLQHWNGHAWKPVTLALPGDGCGAVSVYVLSAPNPSDVWAAGEEGDCGTAVEHWDGVDWSVWDLDSGDDTGSDTTGVAATGADNAWTTGQQCAGAGGCWSVGYHYDGAGWSASSPHRRQTDLWQMTNAAATAGSKETWEVGFYYPTFDEGGVPTSPASPFAGHWNGKRWKVIDPPGRYATDHVLNGVAEVTRTDVWAVGYRLTAANAYRTLIDHWTGTSWTDVGGPNPAPNEDYLAAVVHIPGTTDLWAVGNSDDGALILHY